MPARSETQILAERWYYPTAFAVLVLLYGLTSVANRIESVDGYLYAGSAEFLAIADVHDPRSLLFHKLNQLLALANATAGMPFDTYALLCTPTVLAGAFGVVLMHRFLRRHLQLTPEASAVGAALLAVSYGYWRYANEIEVYIPSICFILTVLCLVCERVSRQAWNQTDFVAPGIIAGLAVLYYQANVIPLFVVMPVLFLLSRHTTAFVAYAAAGSVVVVGGLLIAYAADLSGSASIQGFAAFLSRRSEEFPAPALELISLARAGSAILRDIISLNWLYGSYWGRELIIANAPAHAYYHEGYFFAADQSPWIARLAPVTFAATAYGLALLLIPSIRSSADRRPGRRPFIAFLIAWLLAHAVVVISLDPMEMEVWIIALVPIWALFAVTVSRSHLSPSKLMTASIVVLVMALHNFIGGLKIFSNSQSDLYLRQVDGILRTARKGDFVLFTGPYPPVVKPVRLLVEKLENRYRRAGDAGQFVTPIYSDGDTATIYRFDEHAMQRLPIETVLHDIRMSGRRLIVADEAINPRPLPQKLGGLERSARLSALAARLRQSAVKIHDDPIGAAYVVAP